MINDTDLMAHEYYSEGQQCTKVHDDVMSNREQNESKVNDLCTGKQTKPPDAQPLHEADHHDCSSALDS